MKHNQIKCPHCGNQVNIEDVLYHQMEAKLHLEKQKQDKQFAKELEQLKAKEDAINEAQETFDEKVKKETALQLKAHEQRLQDELKQEKQELIKQFEEQSEQKLKQSLSEQAQAIQSMKEELKLKSIQVQELNASKIEIEKLKREKDEALMEAKLEAQKEISKELALEKAKLATQLVVEKEKLAKEFHDENELKLKAQEKQLEDQKKLIDEMKRKAEQGSMQLQGEVQELAIEAWLSNQFAFDTIKEVKKGAFGADCVQIVHTREAQNCGVICYESKNTKAWSNDWIKKLKSDMLSVKSDIGVLVTSVYPKDMDRMGFVDGVWVCSLDEFKGSVSLLREALIRIHTSKVKEENKSDKALLLYDYLSGNEFGGQMKAIVTNATALKVDLEKEKKAFTKIWKAREKMIDTMIDSIGGIEGDLIGISGNKLSLTHAFELPYGE